MTVVTLTTALYVFGLGAGPFVFAPVSELKGRQTAYVWSMIGFAGVNLGCIFASSYVLFLLILLVSFLSPVRDHNGKRERKGEQRELTIARRLPALIALRFLAGFFGSSGPGLGVATISDLYVALSKIKIQSLILVAQIRAEGEGTTNLRLRYRTPHGFVSTFLPPCRN